MLILSRHVGESVVIIGRKRVNVTVAVIGSEFVDLNVSHRDGASLGTISLQQDDLTPIAEGVQCCIVKADSSKVRLGFDVPQGVNITREEFT